MSSYCVDPIGGILVLYGLYCHTVVNIVAGAFFGSDVIGS